MINSALYPSSCVQIRHDISFANLPCISRYRVGCLLTLENLSSAANYPDYNPIMTSKLPDWSQPYGCCLYFTPPQVWRKSGPFFIQLPQNYPFIIGSLKIHSSAPGLLVSLSTYLSTSLGSIPTTPHVGNNKPTHVIDGKSSSRSPLPRRPIIGQEDHSCDPIGRLGYWLAYSGRVSTHTADSPDVITPQWPLHISYSMSPFIRFDNCHLKLGLRL